MNARSPYDILGINVRRFYKDKFSYGRDFDFTSSLLDFYDIKNFKMLWMLSRVLPRSKVLDFGCGSGTLACLKRIGCEITGLDISGRALREAKRLNRYDFTHEGDIFSFRKNRKLFDYIVSLDVFGHIPSEEKDGVISELKRHLKQGGVMLHGIECGHVDYSGMDKKELARFVGVDGHVGIEPKGQSEDRFRKYFRHVRSNVRYVFFNSADELIKQQEEYGQAGADEALYRFLKSMDADEKRAFDIANGLGIIRLDNEGVASKDSYGGFQFLEASDSPLEDKRIDVRRFEALSRTPSEPMEDPSVFIKGWHGVEKDRSGEFRWSGGRAQLDLSRFKGRKVRFTLSTSYPEKSRSTNVFIECCNKASEGEACQVKKISMTPGKFYDVKFKIDSDNFFIGLFSDTVWKPSLSLQGSADSRVLGFRLGGFSAEP